MWILFLPVVGHSQVLDYLDINMRIIEKVGDELRPLPNTTIDISDIGEVITDEQGRHTFTYPVRNNVDPKISISLLSDSLNILRPLDSSIAIDTTREEMNIEFLVVNMGNENTQFKKQIKKLEQRISKLKATNSLTRQQVSALHTQLMDTILHFENLRHQMESEIREYENLTADQQLEIEAKNDRILDLEVQVDALTQDLAQALEERFLRQKGYFDDITSDLRAFVRHSRDLRNHLKFIRTYFDSQAGYDDYRSAIIEYNAIWTVLDNKRAGYLEGVENYWKNKAHTKQLEDVFDYAKSIHMDQTRPALNDIRMEFSKVRPKKAQKIADLVYDDMGINLKSLEQKINRVETRMRNDL
jgi:chromosome segregation ATPase